MAKNRASDAYHFKDFERYRLGEMSRSEQWKFEKQMLEQPLLAEAYEGFLIRSEAPVAHEAVHQVLAGKLHARIQKRSPKHVMWAYAAAAAITLCLGAFWLATLRPASKVAEQEANVAKVEENVRTMDVISETTKLSLASPDSETALVAPEPVKAIPSNRKPPVFSAAPPAGNLSFPENQPTVQLPALSFARKKPGFLGNQLTSSRATDAVISEDSVTRLLRAARVAVQAAHQSSALDVQEMVVVPEAGSENRQRVAQAPLSGAPAIGWEAYRKYLLENAVSAGRQGRVTVLFTVGPDGSLTDFKPQGDSLLFDRAIRILQNGPAWIPAERDGRKPRVTLYFRK